MISPMPLIPSALLRFHVSVGARLAMRALVPAIVGAVAGGVLLGNDFLVTLAHSLFGPESSGGSWAMIALVAMGAASMAAPRICRGLDGWLRHLPVSGLAHRRAAVLAVAVSQSPLLLLLAVLSLYGTKETEAFLVDALGLGVTGLAAAVLAVPAKRRLARGVLAAASAVMAGSGGWTELGIGILLLGTADGVAGTLGRAKPISGGGALSRRWGGRRGEGRGEGSRAGAPLLTFQTRIAWRALGWRIAGGYALGLLPVLAAFAFVTNNELAPAHQRLGTLLGSATSVVLLFAQLAEMLAVRRPAWPWSRSLPWSAAGRVSFDALFLGLHALPLLGLAVWVLPSRLPLLAVVVIVPFLALRAAGAMRRAPERRAGASGEVLAEGMLLAALVSLLLWTSLLALAGVPFALRAAAERERRQKVSRWLELHHLAVGDPQSWSAS
jgi:hypothetical protein